MNTNKVWTLLFHIIFILFSLTIILPFWMVFIDSIDETAVTGLKLWPKNVDFTPYKVVLEQRNTLQAFLNSIFRSVTGMIIATAVSFGAAYALSKKQIPLNRLMTVYIIIPMFFSGGLIPFYLQMNNLNLMNSRWALILPMVFSGFNIMVTRNFIYSIPGELEESALLDGANELLICVRIYLPLSLPIIATIALWSVVGHWNEYFYGMIFIQSPDKQVLQVLLRRVLMEAQLSEAFDDLASMVQGTPKSIRSALLFVSTLPILIVYPFAQKYFIRGLTAGAVKG